MKTNHPFDALIESELQHAAEVARREDEMMERALDGGPFWGVGKPPVEPGDVRGLAEYLPATRKP